MPQCVCTAASMLLDKGVLLLWGFHASCLFLTAGMTQQWEREGCKCQGDRSSALPLLEPSSKTPRSAPPAQVCQHQRCLIPQSSVIICFSNSTLLFTVLSADELCTTHHDSCMSGMVMKLSLLLGTALVLTIGFSEAAELQASVAQPHIRQCSASIMS